MAKITFDKKNIDKIATKLKLVQKTVPTKIRPRFKEAAEIMKKDVRETIERGNSPVKDHQRFEEYSDSYKKAISKNRYPGKRVRPVNLKLTGRMLKSLAARIYRDGFVVYFTSKLAKIHSVEGAAGKTIRKVTPTDSEQWKPSVLRRANEFLNKGTRQEVIKQLKERFR